MPRLRLGCVSSRVWAYTDLPWSLRRLAAEPRRGFPSTRSRSPCPDLREALKQKKSKKKKNEGKRKKKRRRER